MSLYVLITLLLGIFFSLLFYTIINIYVTNKYWIRILFLLVLALLFKNDWGIHFYGLEYEDAYVFNFIARQFAHNIYSHSFLTDGILVGSMEDPIIMGTYGGHFITYPVFMSYFYRFLGFESHYICYINTFIEFLSLSILSIFPIKINKTNFGFLLPILYCIAPIMNVFSNTGFSETFSSFICLSFLLSAALYIENKSWYNCFFCIICLLLSFVCKRENVCLLIVPFSYVVWNYCRDKIVNKMDLVLFISSSFVLILYLTYIQNIFNIEQIESTDINSSTFSIHYFIQLFPIFIKSLFSINYFSISIYVLVVSAFFVWKRNEYWTLIFIILFAIYLLLYSLHYRGYFFVKYNELSVFETFRYINNFYYLVPLIAASALYKLFIKSKKWIIYLSCTVILIFSLSATFNFRKELSLIEDEDRFHATKIVCQFLEKEDDVVLITENILLYQLISNDKFTICDIAQFSSTNHVFYGKTNFILINDDSIDYLMKRFGISLNFISINPVLIYKNMKLYKIDLEKSSLTIVNNLKTERRCVMN
ncbi:hypothetical protein EZS27_019038 [termite gut metagenome]|uniref:Glycosyltransferase RgtA/B/C/D-like domain-containing protein n=1 Tax=termite gut metagenome TaxID=433724 RepID=A0A5J4RFP3_9ZZZZ